MKKIFILLLISIISIATAFAQYKKDGTPDMRYKANKQTYGSSYSAPKTSYKKSATTYKSPSYTTTRTSNTYEVNGTKYVIGETYKTTGQPKVQRKSSVKKEFLKSKGYSSVPKGYQVDHIIPLSQGGKDTPSNMQLITTEAHKQKTARERNQTSTYNKVPKYTTTRTSNSYKKPKYNTTSTYKVPKYKSLKSKRIK